jgi:hypothetical protein
MVFKVASFNVENMFTRPMRWPIALALKGKTQLTIMLN